MTLGCFWWQSWIKLVIRLKLSLPGSSHGVERANTCRVARQPDSREFPREKTEDEPEEARCPQGRCEIPLSLCFQQMMTKELEGTGEERFKLCFILTSLVSVWWLLDKQKYWITRKWASWWKDLWTSFPKSYSFFEFKVSSWHLAFWGSALIDDQNEQQ